MLISLSVKMLSQVCIKSCFLLLVRVVPRTSLGVKLKTKQSRLTLDHFVHFNKTIAYCLASNDHNLFSEVILQYDNSFIPGIVRVNLCCILSRSSLM